MAYDFVNPGSAFVQEIVKIAAEREAMRRQAMLDEITKQREARLIKHDEQTAKYNDEALASLKASREANAAAQAETMRGKQIENAGKLYQKGDVVESPDGVPKELLEQQMTLPGKSFAAPATPIPSGSPAVMVPGAPMAAQEATGKQTFRGTTEQRELERQLADPDIPEAAKNALRAGAKPTAEMFTGPKSQALFRTSTDRRSVERWDPEKNGFVPHQGPVPKDAHWLQEPNAPTVPVSIRMANEADDESIDMLAKQYISTGQVATRNAALLTRVVSRAAQMAKDAGIDFDPAANAAGFGADKGALGQLTRQIAAVSAFKDTARKNIEVLKGVLQSTPDAGASLLNRPWRALLTMTGSPEMAKFSAALRTVQPEISRILNTANLTGVNTVHAQMEVEKILDPNASVEQMLSALSVLEQDMTNRSTSLAAERAAIEGSIRGRGINGQQPNTKPDAIRYDMNGNRIP